MSYKWNNFCRITCSENINFIIYMKKHLMILSAAALLFAGANASAQSFLSSLLGSSSAASTVTSLVNAVTGGNVVYSAPISLNGTYTYNGIAVSISSSDASAVLTNIAGAAANSTVEAKIDEKLQKVGIKPGSFTMTFNNTDNTFTLNIFGLSLPGSYKIGEGEKTVTLTFGKTMQYFCMTGTLNSTSTGATMLFTADKYLGFAKKVLKNAGEKSTELSSISSLVDNYDQLKIGFKLTK